MSDAPPTPEYNAAPSPADVRDAEALAAKAQDAAAHRPSMVFLAVLAVLALAADLGTKAWALGALADDEANAVRKIRVAGDWLAFTFAKNHGGAFGLLQDQPETIRWPFFLVVSIGAVFFIVSMYRKLEPTQWALRWGLPLVLGGALGNLIDRLRYRYVIDFIDYSADFLKVAIPSGHWPTFNVADVWIVVGVGLMIVDMFTHREQKREPSESA